MQYFKKTLKVVTFLMYFNFFYMFIFGALVFKIYMPQPTGLNYDVSKFKETSAYSQYAYLMEDRLEAFNLRLALIEAAEESIAISYYAVHNDISKDIFYGALLKAADKGVEVEFIIDGFIEGGVFSDHEAIRTLNAHDNITIRYYEPINLFKIYAMQNRLHDKLIIIDNHYAVIGGRNIGNRYYFDMDNPEDETMDRDVLIFGDSKIEAVEAMREYYDELFSSAYSGDIKENFNETVHDYFINTYNDYTKNLDLEQLMNHVHNQAILVEQITFLRSPLTRLHKQPIIFNTLLELSKDYDEVILQSPYFVLNDELSSILRGFSTENITILTNSMHTNPNVLAVSGYLKYRNEFAEISHLYEYQGGVNHHAKTFLFGNDITIIGSLNIDPRSAFLSTESVVVIYSESFNTQTRTYIDDYISRSLRVDGEGNYIENHIEPTASNTVRKIIIWILKPLGSFFDDLL